MQTHSSGDRIVPVRFPIQQATGNLSSGQIDTSTCSNTYLGHSHVGRRLLLTGLFATLQMGHEGGNVVEQFTVVDQQLVRPGLGLQPCTLHDRKIIN
jgi:hypothetical protein